ncbi:MAG: FHA domain-containing protein [Fimbriimonadales bacterium]|nr:FHA domain-containing protein [Fimbriimonadales bacterium]
MRTVWLSTLVAILMLSGFGQPAQPPASKPPATPPEAPAKQPTQQKPTIPPKIEIEFKGEGERWWWAEDAQGNPISIPQKVSEEKVVVKPPEGTATLWVLDSKTGNLARFASDALKETLTIGSDDLTHVARLQVNVRAGERPVATALVSLTDEAGKRQTQVLEPTAEGIVIFERVPLGKVTVEVRYGDDQKSTQEMRLKAERDERVPVLDISLSGEVATVAPPKAAEQQQAPTGSRIGAIVMFLLALALAIGVIVLLVRLALQKEKPLAEAMQKLGVELPQVDTGGAAAPAGAATTAPSAPDLPPLETAGVAPTATLPTATVSATPTRLVGLQGAYAGQVFDISADLITIGREAGNGIVLDGEITVSRRHAQLVRQNGELMVQDLGSTNGTYVNGQRISDLTPLRVGDTVQFGMASFRVE